MIPATLNLRIDQRATFRQAFDLQTDMSGSTLYAQMWDKSRRTKYADFTIEWTDQVAGQFDLVLPYATTRTLLKSGQWDLLQEEPGGERFYWYEGEALVDENYTDTV